MEKAIHQTDLVVAKGDWGKKYRIIHLICLIVAPVLCIADDLQLMLPGNHVSSRPVVEFRARKAYGEVDFNRTPPYIHAGASPGHAYILLNVVARARAEEADEQAFRLMQQQAISVGQRRVGLGLRIAALEGPPRPASESR